MDHNSHAALRLGLGVKTSVPSRTSANSMDTGHAYTKRIRSMEYQGLRETHQADTRRFKKHHTTLGTAT
eukprot:1232755-Amphidinium_carterae.1